MKNEEMTPQIRFKGFNDAWEQRKLKDLFIKGGSGGTPKSNIKKYYNGNIPFLGISDISNTNGFIYETYKHISKEGLDSSAAWIVPEESINLAMYASVGKVSINKVKLATSQAFYNMIFESINIRNFVYFKLKFMNENKSWNKLISTGTQSNLNAYKVKNFNLNIPKNNEEIESISNLMKNVDKIIDFNERKLKIKHDFNSLITDSILNKTIFFGQFSNSWKKRKLKNLNLTFVGGGTPSTNNKEYWYGSIPWIQSSNVGINGIDDLVVSKLISNKAIEDSSAKLIPKKSVSIVTRVGVGKVVVVDVNYSTSQDFISLTNFNGSYRYLGYVTYNLMNRLKERLQGTSIKGITKKDLISEDLYITGNIEEQLKIEKFISENYREIKLLKRNISNLKKFKKYLMQNMFI